MWWKDNSMSGIIELTVILQNQSKLRQNGLQKSLMILSIKIPGTKPGIFLETFQKSPDDQIFFIIQKSDQSFVLLCNSIYDMILNFIALNH